MGPHPVEARGSRNNSEDPGTAHTEKRWLRQTCQYNDRDTGADLEEAAANLAPSTSESKALMASFVDLAASVRNLGILLYWGLNMEAWRHGVYSGFTHTSSGFHAFALWKCCLQALR